jgi:hypothetical protein
MARTDKQAFLEFVNANAGRTDFEPESQAKAELAKLERYISQGGQKAEKYKEKHMELTRIVRFLEEK